MSDHVSYTSEPATLGKIVLVLSCGDLDVELFAKECPKTCRVFMANLITGRYNNVRWGRIIKNFIAQTTADIPEGKQSQWERFPETPETHQRLRFNRRGLLGAVTDGSCVDFFITTGSKAEFLNRKHTLFGKVTGNTIFNLQALNELECEGETPLNPPTILRAELLMNPFSDLQINQISTEIAKESEPKRLKPLSKLDKRNITLLSFNDDDITMNLSNQSTDPHVSASLSIHDKDNQLSVKQVSTRNDHKLTSRLTAAQTLQTEKQQESGIQANDDALSSTAPNEPQVEDKLESMHENSSASVSQSNIQSTQPTPTSQLSLVEKRRQKWLPVNNVVTKKQRQESTLAKLQAFERKVRGVASAEASLSSSVRKTDSEPSIEPWFQHRVDFRRSHLDLK